jgi:hypothetical protein
MREFKLEVVGPIKERSISYAPHDCAVEDSPRRARRIGRAAKLWLT